MHNNHTAYPPSSTLSEDRGCSLMVQIMVRKSCCSAKGGSDLKTENANNLQASEQRYNSCDRPLISVGNSFSWALWHPRHNRQVRSHFHPVLFSSFVTVLHLRFSLRLKPAVRHLLSVVDHPTRVMMHLQNRTELQYAVKRRAPMQVTESICAAFILRRMIAYLPTL